jgi:hypothetical protein
VHSAAKSTAKSTAKLAAKLAASKLPRAGEHAAQHNPLAAVHRPVAADRKEAIADPLDERRPPADRTPDCHVIFVDRRFKEQSVRMTACERNIGIIRRGRGRRKSTLPGRRPGE